MFVWPCIIDINNVADQLDPDADGRTILRWIFRKWEGVETGWSWLRIGTGGGQL